MQKIIVIGASAAGCRTASRIKRNNPENELIIYEKSKLISLATCGLPLYASGDISNFKELMTTQYGVLRDEKYFEMVKGVTVKTENEVIAVDPNKKSISFKDLKSDELIIDNYDKLIIAVGARPIIPQINISNSERVAYAHNAESIIKFKSLAEKGKISTCSIIGAGYIGLEMAEAMTTLWGIETHLIDIKQYPVSNCFDIETAQIINKILTNQDVKLHYSANVESIDYIDNTNIIKLNNNEIIISDFVFICTGVKPATDFLNNSGIKIAENGAININEYFETNYSDIYACGDCINVYNPIICQNLYLPLGSLANKQARILADNIDNKKTKYKGSVGANIFKIFDYQFATSGLNECSATKFNISFNSVCAVFFDRPNYHPDSEKLFAKMLFENKTKKLLGIQMISKGDLGRYIDQFSLMLSNDANIDDLLQVEHCYSPTVSTPESILNHLANIADNLHNLEIKQIPPFADISNYTILDVRQSNVAKNVFETDKYFNIEIGELRAKLGLLTKNDRYIAICAKGSRSYEAAKILNQSNYNCDYLAGGVDFRFIIL